MVNKYLISDDGYIESCITDNNYNRVIVTKDKESILKAIELWLKHINYVCKKDSLRIFEKHVKIRIAETWDCDDDEEYWYKTFYLHKVVEL